MSNWQALLLILVFTFSACSVRQAVPIAAGADLVTTELLLSRDGYKEANPLPVAQSTGGRVALKLAVSALVIWACEWLDSKGEHRLSSVLKWTAAGVWGAAATWHAYLARGM